MFVCLFFTLCIILVCIPFINYVCILPFCIWENTSITLSKTFCKDFVIMRNIHNTGMGSILLDMWCSTSKGGGHQVKSVLSLLFDVSELFLALKCRFIYQNWSHFIVGREKKNPDCSLKGLPFLYIFIHFKKVTAAKLTLTMCCISYKILNNIQLNRGRQPLPAPLSCGFSRSAWHALDIYHAPDYM